MQSVPSGHALPNLIECGEAQALHPTNLRHLSERSPTRVRRAPATTPPTPRYRGHSLRGGPLWRRPGMAIIFALTEKLERNGASLSISHFQVAGHLEAGSPNEAPSAAWSEGAPA
jgi:hypothetical protein